MQPPIDPATYQTLFETAPDATLLVDGDGRIVMANRQAEVLFGRARDALVGQAVETLVPARFRPGHAALRRGFADAPSVRAMGGEQLFALGPDDVEIPVEIAIGPIETSQGRLVVASVRDISKLARTRQAASRGRYNYYIAEFGLRALGEPEFSRLLDIAGPLIAEAMQVDAVITFRLSQDHREFAAVSGFGVTPDDLRLMRAPNDGTSLLGWLFVSREPVAVPDTHTETRFQIMEVIKGLGLRSALCVPLFDAGQVIGGLTARGREPRTWYDDDIHFMQAIANTLATALQRAAAEERLLHAQRLEALGQLTGGVAHDFNNLLMVISGNLQIMQDVIGEQPEALELLRQAVGASERGAMLTRKLLAFARKQPLNPTLVDLNHLVTDFRDLVQRTFGEHIAVRLKLEPRLPLLMVDATQLETALLNLALNARDAMLQGGELLLETDRLQVTQEAEMADLELAPGEYALLSVADTGTGMRPEVLARAIEPFFTTKGAGKGNGLGLSMVYGFARQSEGSVRLRSELGKGTTVQLLLPMPAEPGGKAVAAPEVPVAAGSETLLLVEDDAAVLNIAARFLTQLGYRVLRARDAVAALEALRGNEQVALLFTDLSLPGMDGIELARTARALRPTIPVLYTSGYMSGATMERLPAEERANLLTKPYLREELAIRVHALLAKARP